MIMGNDVLKSATLFSTSLLPCVGDQIFSVLKLLCLLFQVIQELLPFKGARGRLGGLILLPQARRQQCILQWQLRGRCTEREKEREQSAAEDSHSSRNSSLKNGELNLSRSFTCKETNNMGGAEACPRSLADRGRARLALRSLNHTCFPASNIVLKARG